MILAEIVPRDVPRGEPVEFDIVISEEGVPVFTGWQPFSTAEEAEAVVRRHYSLEPVTMKITDRAGSETVQEIR